MAAYCHRSHIHVSLADAVLCDSRETAAEWKLWMLSERLPEEGPKTVTIPQLRRGRLISRLRRRARDRAIDWLAWALIGAGCLWSVLAVLVPVVIAIFAVGLIAGWWTW